MSEREKPAVGNVVSAGGYSFVGSSLFLAHASPGSERLSGRVSVCPCPLNGYMQPGDGLPRL